MTRWTMVADLERCVGCQTCTAACRHANATSPAIQWRKVLDVECGTYPNVSRTFVPVGCQHCADPPCMHVCPTTATRQRPDGIVTIDYDICIGCAYCEVACPYQARFLEHAPHFAYGAPALPNEIERADEARFGVAQKCTFCADRIDFGITNGLTPGVDPDATPACVNACIADALHFGDIDDSNSNVSRLLREQRSFRMHEELGTAPGFHYLYGKANGQDGQDKAGDPPDALAMPSEQAGGLRTRGVEPWHQPHWDWKAAGNFICGGMGAGLLAFVAATSVQDTSVAVLGWAALAIIALGLFLVWVKIGRPWRFVHVLRQPQRSWMSREAWIAGLLFPLTAYAIWWQSSVWMIFAAVVGLLFLFSQAMILREAKGVPAWRTQSVVPLIVCTGLAEGGGVFLIAADLLAPFAANAPVASAAVVILAAVRAWTWRSYLHSLAAEGAPTRTFVALESVRPWFLVLGLAVPVLLILLSFAAPNSAPILLTLAGGCVTASF